MPEGPEVRITADGLKKCLKGKHITNISINSASKYKTGLKRYNKLTFPLYVNDIITKGKKILIITTPIPIEGIKIKYETIVFISALGMEGSWRLEDGKHAGIEIDFINTTKLYNNKRLPITNSNISNRLYFHDTRHFGSFDICTKQKHIDHCLKSVGPDLLQSEIPFEEYYNVISQKKLKHKEICWFMMEQKFFSGIGNYLLAEILYSSGIMPNRELNTLSSEEIQKLWYYSINIIKESYKCGGLTISTYFSMDGKRGVFIPQVYGRNYDKLGNKVETKTFSNKRTSHFVKNVQV